ncbi:MAG: hypothetical protein ACRD4Y_11495, partial [Candidatus Acidiferrales bacterium]
MRIKIIGENNCARATRYLLRLAGFAVTEFLPADVITAAPHSGYAITIELAPAPQPLIPASEPDSPTHGQPAARHEEANGIFPGASSPASSLDSQRGSIARHIQFDSVESELESAVLRHVTRMAKVPAIVDRPGGV